MTPPSPSSKDGKGFGSHSKTNSNSNSKHAVDNVVINMKAKKQKQKKQKSGLAEVQALDATATASRTTTKTKEVPDAIQKALQAYQLDVEKVDAKRFQADLEEQQVELDQFDTAKKQTQPKEAQDVFQVSSNMASLEQDYQNDQVVLADEAELHLEDISNELDLPETTTTISVEDDTAELDLIQRAEQEAEELVNLVLDDVLAKKDMREQDTLVEQEQALEEDTLGEDDRQGETMFMVDPSADYDMDEEEIPVVDNKKKSVKIELEPFDPKAAVVEETKEEEFDLDPFEATALEDTKEEPATEEEVELEEVVTTSFAADMKEQLQKSANDDNRDKNLNGLGQVDMNAFVVSTDEMESLKDEYSNDELVLEEEEVKEELVLQVEHEVKDRPVARNVKKTVVEETVREKKKAMAPPRMNLNMDGIPKFDMESLPNLPKNPFEGIKMPTMGGFEMPKFDINDKQVQQVITKAQQSAKSILQLGQEATKLMADEALLLRASMKTTNVDTLSKDGQEITYEEALQKVTKSGQGLLVLAQALGGFVKDSAINANIHFELDPTQAEAVFHHIQETVKTNVANLQDKMKKPEVRMDDSPSATIPLEASVDVDLEEPKAKERVYVEDDKGNFQVKSSSSSQSPFLTWQEAAAEAMANLQQNFHNKPQTLGEADEPKKMNWQESASAVMANFQKPKGVSKRKVEHEDDDDDEPKKNSPFFFTN